MKNGEASKKKWDNILQFRCAMFIEKRVMVMGNLSARSHAQERPACRGNCHDVLAGGYTIEKKWAQ